MNIKPPATNEDEPNIELDPTIYEPHKSETQIREEAHAPYSERAETDEEYEERA